MIENILLSVIIPAYNEEANITGTLDEITAYFSGKDFAYEVIMVDDGSGDDTVELAAKYKNILDNFNIIRNGSNKGKGFVVNKGILQAKGKYCMFMDADNSTSIYEIDAFLPYLENDYDAVIASRRLKNSNVVTSESPLRIILGNIYILLSQLIIGVSVSDFNCGFKAYRTKSAKEIFSRQKMNDWSFDTEIIFIIKKLGMRIKELPVKWAHKDTSKVKPFKAGIESFINLIRIRLNDFKGKYA